VALPQRILTLPRFTRTPGDAWTVRVHTGVMNMSYERAVAVQNRHQQRLLALPGVSAVGVKMREGRPVLAVTVDEGSELPADLQPGDIDGLDLTVERGRYLPQ
jgi:hypothetical protein